MRIVARALERGLPSWAPLRALEASWAAMARVDRPLRIPAATRVIAIGGATLGGSGRTPVAVALAAEAARLGVKVALVSHAYRAHAPAPRWVTARDDAGAVGDEAAAAAGALERAGARVVSCDDRQAAVDLAAAWAEVLVLDGPLQLRPRRADWSLLAVDHDTPWGSGACPPRGDLRAPRAELLAHADAVVRVRTDGRPPVHREASWVMRGATNTLTGEALSLERVCESPVHLVTNLARPERVARCLEAHGVRVAHHTTLDDHSRADAPDPLHVKGLLRLATDKTRQAAGWPNAAWIQADLTLSDALRHELARRLDALP